MRYPAVGKCIYCGSTSGSLTAEHIIPSGLGGVDRILAASCKSCERVTGQEIERPCLRRMLLSPRTHWKIKSTHPKERPTELNIGIGTPTVNFEWKAVPIHEHPLIFMMPAFAEPGLLRGIAPTRSFETTRLWAYIDEQAQGRLEHQGETARVYQPFSPDKFCRMIAKIAHCQAVASFGVDAFDALLPGLILGRTEIISHYVGGSPYTQDATIPSGPVTEVTHEMRLRERISVKGDRRLVSAVIRLFANLNAPAYEALVGFRRT
jgi:HNH endonuclease